MSQNAWCTSMKHDAVVTRVRIEALSISTIFFTVDNKKYDFIAGQYLTVYFNQTGFKAGKAYSISSSPLDNEVSITVKNVGEFSGLLCALKPGDHFEISSPYGFFNVNDDLPIIAIAAGVGVAPLWSIIRSELVKAPAREVQLYLTAPTEQELVFHDDINIVFSRHDNTKAKYFVTREPSAKGHARRFEVTADIPATSLPTSRFYVCGSQDFVRAMWLQLMEAGVQEDYVVTETFYESAL